MATLSSPSLFLLLLLQLFSVLCPAAAAPIDDACNQTKNPKLCISILNAFDAHSSTAPLQALEEIAINAMAGTIRQVKQHLSDLYHETKEKKLRKLYGTYLHLYKGALGAIEGAAKQYLKHRSYGKIEAAVELVQRAVDRSATVVGKLGGSLQKASDDLKVLGEAIDAIAQRLR